MLIPLVFEPPVRMDVTEDDLEDYTILQDYDDGTFVRIMNRRTSSDAYPSGWRYVMHYGVTDPDEADVPTLEDGTIRRYDNAHEDTKGHEPHVAPNPEPDTIEFSGIVDLHARFWEEVPKPAIAP